jgi:hypothetical protein
MVNTLEESDHTSVQQRIVHAVEQPEVLKQPLQSILGIARCLPFKLHEYLELVEYSGQQWHEGKRGTLRGNTPS